MTYHRSCARCNKPFSSSWSHQRFCSKICRQKSYNKQASLDCGLKIPKPTIGTIAELEVCNMLLRLGFFVFRSIAPSASCDLIALRDEQFARIEVRSGVRNPETFKVSWPKPKHNLYDLLIVYLHREKEFIYISETKRGREMTKSILSHPTAL